MSVSTEPKHPQAMGMWLPLAPVLISAALISSIIVTLGAPLIPLMQERFAISSEEAQWSYTITLLVAAACTPIFGRMADGRRRRPVTVLVCGLVSVGCIISALADSFSMLLIGRGMQGLGVSLVAMTIAAARAYLPAHSAQSTVAILSITTALGAGIGYPITTYIADHMGMGVAFGVAGAFSAIVAVIVLIRLPPAGDVATPRADLVGMLLLVTGVTSYLLAITHGNSWHWFSFQVLVLFGAGTALLAFWIRWEFHTPFPLVKLQLMANRRLLSADVIALFMGVSLYSTPVLVSRLVQLPTSTGYGLGLSLTVAGMIMIPIVFGNLLGSRIIFLGGRFGGARVSLILGSGLAMVGALVLTTEHVSIPVLVLAMSLTAIGAGATFGSMPALVIEAVPEQETGSAMSFNLLLRTMGGTIGSALTAASLGAFTPPGHDYAEWAGFRLAFSICAFACLTALVVSLVLVPRSSTQQSR